MWYAKMYFSEKKEVFQFDSHGIQGVPLTYKELPFLESLLSFLEADCKELEPLLRRAYENWSLLIDRDDRDAGVRTLMDLGDLGSRHIYLHLLYVRWFERFGRMGITQDRGSREDQQMLEELRQASIVPVMCSVLPVFGGNQAVAQAYNDQVLRLNRRLYALCVDTGVRYVDYHSQMTAEDGHTLRADLSWDGVHPHVLGYNRMANALAPVLEELLKPTSVANVVRKEGSNDG